MPRAPITRARKVFLRGAATCAVANSEAFRLAGSILTKVRALWSCRGRRWRSWRSGRRILRSLLNRGRRTNAGSHPQAETRIGVRRIRYRCVLQRRAGRARRSAGARVHRTESICPQRPLFRLPSDNPHQPDNREKGRSNRYAFQNFQGSIMRSLESADPVRRIQRSGGL